METHLGKNSLWSNDVLGGTGDGPAVTEETVEELQNSILNSIPDEDLAGAKISDFEVRLLINAWSFQLYAAGLTAIFHVSVPTKKNGEKQR